VTIAMMPADLLVGLAVTSHTNSDAAIATFESLTLSSITDVTWAHSEVGTLGGYVSGAPASFMVARAGKGIANKKDAIAFVHEVTQHVGDVELTGHLTALTSPGQETLRAGFMVRGNLSEGGRMASFLVELSKTHQQRYLVIRRAQDDG